MNLPRIDTAKRAGRIIAAVMSCVILIMIVFGLGIRSLNNMLAVFGLGIPFCGLLRGAWIPVYLATSSIFVLSAVIVRKYGLTTNFEEPTSEVHEKWTVGGTMTLVSVVLIFLGALLAYVDLSFQGLIIITSGLVMFPIGRLVWKRIR